MKKEKEKPDHSGPDSHKIPRITDLSDRVPTMTDPELASLLANATRLSLSGSAQQRGSAALLLPVVEAEIARRKALKSANSRKSPAAKKRKVVAESASEPEPRGIDEDLDA